MEGLNQSSWSFLPSITNQGSCSAFTRYCYKEAGKDFIGPEISVSNTTPEDIGQAGVKAGAIKIFRP